MGRTMGSARVLTDGVHTSGPGATCDVGSGILSATRVDHTWGQAPTTPSPPLPCQWGGASVPAGLSPPTLRAEVPKGGTPFEYRHPTVLKNSGGFGGGAGSWSGPGAGWGQKNFTPTYVPQNDQCVALILLVCMLDKTISLLSPQPRPVPGPVPIPDVHTVAHLNCSATRDRLRYLGQQWHYGFKVHGTYR